MSIATHRANGRPADPPEVDARAADDSAPMSKRETLEALSGLLLALFVGILSSTIVSNALPRITSDLGGTQSQYTWVVTASLLAATATTPIWGKLADLFSKKLLVQLAIVVFVVGSMLCGLSQSMLMLIGFRVIQGVGMGGLQALSQVVMGAMIPPRERGKYSGYLGAVMAVGTIGGPLLGGVIVDTSWLGWRWTFYVCVPIALIALAVLQKTLHLPTLKRKVSIDWAGATLIALGVSLLLAWVSFAGHNFAWMSWQTAAMAGTGVVALLLAIFVESKVPEPIIPLPIVGNRTTALAIIASISVGLGMYGASVFFGQYFQISRGWSPTKAGLATIPMIVALLIASTVSGLLISKFGRWKPFLVVGTLLLVAGMGLLGTIDHATSYSLIAIYMVLLGGGVGMSMQNLVLAVQNTVDVRNIGVASSVVTFFRSMGGAAGVSVLGAVAATQVSNKVTDGLQAMGAPAPSGGGSESLDLTVLPAPVAQLVRAVYGDVIGNMFVIAAVLSAIAVLAVLFIKEVPLRRSNALTDHEPTPEHLVVPGAVDELDRPRNEAATRTLAPVAELTPDTPIGEDTPRLSATASNGHGSAPAECVVLGRILRGDGQPLAGASVTLADVGGHQVDRTHAGSDGAYRLHPRGRGTYLLIASAPHVAPNATMIAVADTPVRHDLALAGNAVLRGCVRDADDEPIGGALVTLTDVQGDVVASVTTPPGGDFVIYQLFAGTYTLTGQAPGHQPAARSVELADGTTVDQDLTLVGATRLTGTVRAHTDGRPLPDATVTLLDEHGNVLATTRTGEKGDYAFDDLLAGNYTVIVSGYAPVASALHLPGGHLAEHDLTLGLDQ